MVLTAVPPVSSYTAGPSSKNVLPSSLPVTPTDSVSAALRFKTAGAKLTSDLIWGPMFICVALFVAILANFIFRIQQAKEHTGINPMSITNAWAHANLKGASL